MNACEKLAKAAQAAIEAEGKVRYRRGPVMTGHQRELAKAANKAIAIDLRAALLEYRSATDTEVSA